MTESEQFEQLLRIRTLVQWGLRAVRAAGFPLAAGVLNAAPLNPSQGYFCLQKAILRVVEMTAPWPIVGPSPTARIGVVVGGLQIALSALPFLPHPQWLEMVDRLLGTLPEVFGGDPAGLPWPDIETERIILAT